MESKIIYKKMNEYIPGKIEFKSKESFFKKINDVPLDLLNIVLQDSFKNYLISILKSHNSSGGGTNETYISFHDDYAYVMSQIYYILADRMTEKLKIKKTHLLKFINIWTEFQNKEIPKIILKRKNDQLIIEGDDIFYSSNFEIEDPYEDILSFIKKSNNYVVNKENLENSKKDITLDIMSDILQKEDINLIKQDIKNNRKYVGKEITIINNLEIGWTNINYSKYKDKTLKVVSEDFPSFLDFWQWLLSQDTEKINLMIEGNFITLYGIYLSISVEFELEVKNK